MKIQDFATSALLISLTTLILTISYGVFVDIDNRDYPELIRQSKAISLDNKVFRCNQVLSDIGNKRGEK